MKRMGQDEVIKTTTCSPNPNYVGPTKYRYILYMKRRKRINKSKGSLSLSYPILVYVPSATKGALYTHTSSSWINTVRRLHTTTRVQYTSSSSLFSSSLCYGTLNNKTHTLAHIQTAIIRRWLVGTKVNNDTYQYPQKRVY